MSTPNESDAVIADVSDRTAGPVDDEDVAKAHDRADGEDGNGGDSSTHAGLDGDAEKMDLGVKAAAPVMVEPSAVPNDSSSTPLPQRISSIPPTSLGSPRTPQSASLPTPNSAQASLLPAAQSLPTASAPAPCSPAPRRPAPPTKGILKPPPPPPKPTFSNRLRDLAVNVVGGAPAVHPGGIGGRGMYEPAVQAQVQAQAQAQADARAQSGVSDPNGREVPTGRGSYLAQGGQPGDSAQRPTEQRLQEVSAAVGGTLNALGGRIGMGFSRFVNAATNGNTASGNGSASASISGRPASSATSPITSSNTSHGSVTSPLPTGTGRTSAAVRSLFDFDTSEPISLARISSAASVESEKSRKQPLRRATFVLPSLSIVYPISTYGEPWSLKVAEDRKRVESSHRSLISATTGAQYWTPHRLVLLYETACKGREERSRVGIVRALESLSSSPRPRTLHLLLRPFDLSQPSLTPPPYTLDTPLTRHAAEALADVLTIEWGLAELKLEGGMIEDEASLKSILHALLISGTLPMLSLAGSRKVRSGGWRLLAVFMRKARSLRYIDLSETSWDKRGMEYFVQAFSTTTASPQTALAGMPIAPATRETVSTADIASSGDIPRPSLDIDAQKQEESVDAYGSFLPPAPLLRNGEESGKPAAVQTLRMDECNLRHNVLEVLANGIRHSNVKNLSLRRNRIGPLGGVSLAVMIRDYTESTAAARFVSHQGRLGESLPPLPNEGAPSEEHSLSPLSSSSAPEGRSSPAPFTSPTATASATVAQRSSAEARLAAATANAMESDMTASMRRDVSTTEPAKRVGVLLTLDLKGNDIRSGVQYIAQVLKRNRTLKVLNMSDNRIDSAGLAVLAEALKYNSTLETLDLSSNPCCAPGLEGVLALRSALGVNKTLKRLFLSDTGLTAEGAISIAECLPDASSLLHLDLTANPIDLAGAIALSSGLKSNGNIRCLDVTIIPSDTDMADASQSILQTCIHNTEAAVAAVTAKTDHNDGAGRSVDALWLPIKRSTLVRQAKEVDEYRADQARINLATSTQGLAREYVYKLSPAKLVPAAERTGRDLEKWLAAGRIAKRPGRNGAWQPGQLPKEEFDVLVERARVLKERLVDEAQRIPDDGADGASGGSEGGMELLIRMIELKESIEAVLEDARGFIPPPRLLLPSQIIPPTPSAAPSSNASLGNGQPPHPIARHRRHVRGASLEISSPNFSIGDSDNDSDADAEEVDMDMARLASPASRNPAVPGLSKLRTHSELGSSSTSSPSGSIGGRSKLGQRTQSHQPGSATSTLAQVPDAEPSKDKRPQIGIDTRLELPPGDETDAVMAALLEAANSPQEETERSRKWVEEEGEVFRKSTKLGVVKSETGVEKGDAGAEGASGKQRMTGDDGVSGEALKQEILDTEVARDHERRVIPLTDDDDNETRREDDDAK